MIIHAQRTFDKFYIDMDNSAEFIEYISHSIERELVSKVVDKLKDHKPSIIKLHKPRFIEDLPESWNHQCVYKQELEYIEVVQCKDCVRNFPWCQRFRDELGDDGFCPYGKPRCQRFRDELGDDGFCPYGKQLAPLKIDKSQEEEDNLREICRSFIDIVEETMKDDRVSISTSETEGDE